ncbi:SpdD-like protein [Streptomyces sp. NPDC057411]|uniref:SpdD-like protein n=1 Tax=unclassified Streptomyces TaxID=2593676 RepID=UPI003644D450
MLRPRIPVNPLPTGIVTPLIHPTPAPTADIELHHTSELMDCGHNHSHSQAPAPVTPARSTVQLTPGSALALVAGGGAVVLVVGAVLVSMLLAVAITAASVAVCAVVLRSLLNQERNR